MRAPRTIGAVAETCPAAAGRVMRCSLAPAAVAARTTARAHKAGFVAINASTSELFTFNSLRRALRVLPISLWDPPCPGAHEHLRILYRLPLHGDSPASARK